MSDLDNNTSSNDSTSISLKEQVEDFFTGVPRPWFQVFFPAVSVLFITLAAYFSISTGKHKAEETLITIAHQALRTNNLTQIEDVLEKLILAKGLDQKQLLDNYRNLIGIISDLRKNEVPAAVEKIQSLPSTSFRGLVDGERETNALYNRIQQDFNNLVNDYKKFEQATINAPKRTEEILKQTNRILTDMNNLSFEYAGIFSLAPATTGRIGFDDSAGILKIEKITLYQNGTLAGLPALRGVPDGIQNRIALREKLDELGGRINLSGTNLAVEFDERLKKFRSEFRQHDSSIKRLELEYEQLQKVQGPSSYEPPDYLKRLASALALLIVKSLQN